jgi:hypothetical protein
MYNILQSNTLKESEANFLNITATRLIIGYILIKLDEKSRRNTSKVYGTVILTKIFEF